MENTTKENLNVRVEDVPVKIQKYKQVYREIPRKLPPQKDHQVFLQKPRNQVPQHTAINFQQIYEAAFGKFLPVSIKNY